MLCQISSSKGGKWDNTEFYSIYSYDSCNTHVLTISVRTPMDNCSYLVFSILGGFPVEKSQIIAQPYHVGARNYGHS